MQNKIDLNLILNDQDLLGEGHTRSAYLHPHDPDWVVKVVNHRKARVLYKRRIMRYNLWRYNLYRDWQKEYSEYIAFIARHNRLPAFFVPMAGFVQTNKGVGMVVGIVRDRDNNVAPSVRDFVDRGGDPTVIDALVDEFFDLLRDTGSVISDLHPKNIAVAFDRETNRDWLVAFDGFGDDVLIRFRVFSKFLRGRWVERRRKKMKAWIAKRYADNDADNAAKST